MSNQNIHSIGFRGLLTANQNEEESEEKLRQCESKRSRRVDTQAVYQGCGRCNELEVECKPFDLTCSVATYCRKTANGEYPVIGTVRPNAAGCKGLNPTPEGSRC
jgi:hypothetical protein